MSRLKIELPKKRDRLHFLNMLMGTGCATHMIIEGLWFNCMVSEDTNCIGQVLAVEVEPYNGILFRVRLMQDRVLTAKQFVEQVDCVHIKVPKSMLLMWFGTSPKAFATPYAKSTNLIDKVLAR
jgi:hypothetical protein